MKKTSPSGDTRGGIQSCLNLMCLALFKSLGGLPFWMERKGVGGEKVGRKKEWGLEGTQEEKREGKPVSM